VKVFEGQTKKLEIGKEAEDFTVGNDLFLSDLRGSPIFLIFWKAL
jgi:hypothetical protein